MDHEKRKKQRLNHDTIGAPQRQPLHLNTITAHPLSTTAATPTLDSDDDFVDADIPRDTEAAIMILKKEFPASIQGVHPFATKNQIYTILKDRTTVDRELDELKHKNRLRFFKLPSGGVEDYAIMLTSDYEATVHHQQRHQSTTTSVFDAFISHVLPQCCDTTITKDELLRLLTAHRPLRMLVTNNNDYVAVLLEAGVIIRHIDSSSDRFLFSMPNAGPAVRGIGTGRKEVLGILKKRKHSEILVRELMKRKLKTSPLGVRWHLRDLVGSGLVVEIQTTVGVLIRAATSGSGGGRSRNL